MILFSGSSNARDSANVITAFIFTQRIRPDHVYINIGDATRQVVTYLYCRRMIAMRQDMAVANDYFGVMLKAWQAGDT